MKNFTKDFLNRYVCTNVEEGMQVTVGGEYREFLVEILGRKLKKGVCLISSDSQPTYVSLNIGDIYKENTCVDLGYSRVERVWSSGEYSQLGENVLIWPYSSKNIYRISLLGNEIEKIEVLEPESRRSIKCVDTLRIFSRSEDIVVGNEGGKEILMLKWVPNIFLEDDVLDLGVRSLPSFSLPSLSKSSMNILNDYRAKGYVIWYLTNDLFKYDTNSHISKYIDAIYEVDDCVEGTLKHGFVYERGKLLILTDSEVLGEVILKRGNLSKEVDPSSVELLKKILVGDFVVHEDHGIGKFLGLTEKENIKYIEIGYAGNDKLFVPLRSSEKVMKYIGSGKARPKLTGLTVEYGEESQIRQRGCRANC